MANSQSRTDEAMHIEGGWVFFYQSKKFLETGSLSNILAGNAPVIVSGSDSVLHVTGTAHPVEFYIENFRKYGSPRGNGAA